MRIGAKHSHLNGFEWILVHRPQIWSEIQTVVGGIDAEACRTKVSKERRSKGSRFYSPRDLNEAFKAAFSQLGWSESRIGYYVCDDADLIRHIERLEPLEQRRQIENAGRVPIHSYNQTDFMKDSVAIEVQFGKYAFVSYDLSVKHLSFYVSGAINVGVEILPLKSLQAQMSSGVPYYEKALYDVVRQGRTSPPVPLVLLGIEP